MMCLTTFYKCNQKVNVKYVFMMALKLERKPLSDPKTKLGLKQKCNLLQKCLSFNCSVRANLFFMANSLTPDCKYFEKQNLTHSFLSGIINGSKEHFWAKKSPLKKSVKFVEIYFIL